ncbi:hypothetical protein [Cupriavidus oxalaticus]
MCKVAEKMKSFACEVAGYVLASMLLVGAGVLAWDERELAK